MPGQQEHGERLLPGGPGHDLVAGECSLPLPRIRSRMQVLPRGSSLRSLCVSSSPKVTARGGGGGPAMGQVEAGKGPPSWERRDGVPGIGFGVWWGRLSLLILFPLCPPDWSLSLCQQRGLRPLYWTGGLGCGRGPGRGGLRVECKQAGVDAAAGGCRDLGRRRDLDRAPVGSALGLSGQPVSRRGLFPGTDGLQNARVLDRELSLGHRGRKRQILPLFRFSGGSGLQSAGPGCRVCGSWGLPSSLCPCPPQATYVLLALAWVFVPIYISSEVSLLPGTQGGLTCVGALLPWLGDADEQEPRLHVVEPAHRSQGCQGFFLGQLTFLSTMKTRPRGPQPGSRVCWFPRPLLAASGG